MVLYWKESTEISILPLKQLNAINVRLVLIYIFQNKTMIDKQIKLNINSERKWKVMQRTLHVRDKSHTTPFRPHVLLLGSFREFKVPILYPEELLISSGHIIQNELSGIVQPWSIKGKRRFPFHSVKCYQLSKLLHNESNHLKLHCLGKSVFHSSGIGVILCLGMEIFVIL